MDEDGFAIKYPTKIDIPLSKETKPNKNIKTRSLFRLWSIFPVLFHVQTYLSPEDKFGDNYIQVLFFIKIIFLLQIFLAFSWTDHCRASTFINLSYSVHYIWD